MDAGREGDTVMFNIAITFGSGQSVTAKQDVIADTLTDAEGYAKAMLDRLFPDKQYVIIYRDDLQYDVHFVYEPDARIEITQGG